MMSGGLGRLSSTAQSSFNRMSASASGMTNRNQVLGMSFNELQRKIQQVESTIRSSTIPSQIAEARRELAALQRQSAGHAGNMGAGASSAGASGGIGIGGVAIGSMLGGIAMQAGSAIIGAVDSAITKSMEKEQAITGLTTFLGKQGATEAYKNIRKDADVTPFDTASLLEVNRGLISAQLNAKDARKDTMNLANAVSAVGGGNDVLSRMAANMQQIKTVGKATAMDIRQFGIAGINIYEMLHRSTGKSIEQVKEMDVTYADLSKAMEMANSKGGIYEGAMAAQSQTKGGKWSTVKDKLGNAASDLGDAFSPLIHQFLDQGIGFLNGLPEMLAKAQPFIESMSWGIGFVIDSLVGGISNIMSFVNWLGSGSTGADIFTIAVAALTGGFLAYKTMMGYTAIKTVLVTGAQWLLNAAMTANPIGIVVVAVGALVAGLVMAYYKFEGFRAMVNGVWGVLKQVGSNIMGMFSKLPDMIIESFTRIPEAIKQVFSGVGDLFSAIFSGDFSAIPDILKSIGSNLIKSNPMTGLASQVFDEATKGVGNAYTKAHEKSLFESKVAKAKAIKDKARQAALEAQGKTLGMGASLASSNASSGKTAGDTVTGGGPKTVNINLGKFFDTIQFTTLNTGETVEELEKIVLESLGRVLYNGSKLI
jgi:tape measure domain-containing protein